MIIEKILFTTTALGFAVQDIAVVSIPKQDAEGLYKIYKPVKIIAKNNNKPTTVDFMAFTDSEYAQYVATPHFCGKETIAIGGTFEYVPVFGNITKLVIECAAFVLGQSFEVEVWKE